MFYRDERFNEILINIPSSLCKMHSLTLADIEVYSYIYKYNIKHAALFGVDENSLLKGLSELDDKVILKSLAALDKLKLIEVKVTNKMKFYRSHEAVNINDLKDKEYVYISKPLAS